MGLEFGRNRIASNGLKHSLRRVERLLLAVGVVLVGIYGIAQLHAAMSSQMGIWRFQMLQQYAEAETSKLDSGEENQEEVDFSLWAEKRIIKYKQSLLENWEAPLAILRIPKIRLEVAVYDGTDDLTLNRSVGRIIGTANIGEVGNIGIAGHRDGFFRGLKDIEVGDSFDLITLENTMTYYVDNIEIVNPDRVDVLQPGSEPAVTLVTCYPFYFIGAAPQRFIVHAILKQ